MRRLAGAVALGALIAACTSGEDRATNGSDDGFTVLSPGPTDGPTPTAGPDPSPTTPDGPAPTPNVADQTPTADVPPPSPTATAGPAELPAAVPDVELVFTDVARLDAPMAVRIRPGSDWMYVAERAGRIVELATPDLAPRADAVLDISEEVSTAGERGFLGFDFSADGTLVWTLHNDLDGTSVLTEWTLGSDGLVDRGTRRELLRVDQPFTNHNGGDVHLGPDGLLWFGLGDGGGGGDPQANGQDPTTLLGTILRIDPTPGTDRPFSIPPDNPFVTGGGAPEVWAYGLRNPWRFSFDSATGDLWIGDVGQNLYEELDLLPAAEDRLPGANLGWNDFEGDEPFASSTPPPDHVGPVLVYDHGDSRCSVTGGVVYRGAAIPELGGVYVFGDLCDGVVRGFVPGVGVAPLNLTPVGASIISFGVDTAGELLVLGGDGLIRRIGPG